MSFSFAICTTIYGAIAVIGYLMFGDKTLSQITLNLPKDSFASKVALWTTVNVVYLPCSFPKIPSSSFIYNHYCTLFLFPGDYSFHKVSSYALVIRLWTLKASGITLCLSMSATPISDFFLLK